ncbi:hypothetical protein, partial [Rhodoplanes serenus]
FEVSYFERVWRSIANLPGRTFLLGRADGTVLVRFPDPKRRAGENLPATSPWHRLVAEGGGSFLGGGVFDSERRWIVVTPLQRYPLV